jgi:hypothetical protein
MPWIGGARSVPGPAWHVCSLQQRVTDDDNRAGQREYVRLAARRSSLLALIPNSAARLANSEPTASALRLTNVYPVRQLRAVTALRLLIVMVP